MIPKLFSKFRRAFGLLFQSRIDAWVLHGQELATGEPLCIAYMGMEAMKNHYVNQAFREGFTAKYLGKCRPILLRFQVLFSDRDCDLIVYQIKEELEPLAYFIGRSVRNPVWMRLELEVSGSLEKCMRKEQYKEIKREIKKASLSYEIRKDDAAFEEFYQRMYLPAVKSRHGDEAMVGGYEMLKNKFKKGELLMVKMNGQYVGAGLTDYSQVKPQLVVTGILDGSDEYMKLGVGGAIYYFQFERALEMGGKIISLGSSRGFLKDGPLRFKVSLGAALSGFHVEDAGFLYLQARRMTPGLKAFLINNPFFMFDREEQYCAAIFVDSAKSVPGTVQSQIEKFTQKNVLPKIYSFDPPDYLNKNAAALSASLQCPVESAYTLFQ